MMVLSGTSSDGVTLTKMRLQAPKQIAQTSTTKAAATNNLLNYAKKLELYCSVAPCQEDLREHP